ncbi:hypothetical protein ZS64_10585 [Salmonella enterica subsp. enterica serovar Montevideo]|nr:hypothetical protein [Salmonella enterica subsp. enterica serovar Montevideo]EEB2064393.1 hypothetical protein [Salmonella enterica]EBX4795704.1 hypothetical protein [Salmonella enterica subsp. enterica serovar Montevideo]EBY0618438.1 hypothetical protein [Salmonella enterica subsp. enterica serovar Montevideo]EBY0683097.1 hypothetical protein [Salmonella enterica subsp. enterica serovar Montevideo]
MWSIFGCGGKYHFFIDYTQKISLRKGVYIPLQQGLSAVQCGFARHARPLKATINYSGVDIVWTLVTSVPPLSGLSETASCKYSGEKCA